MHLPQQFYPAPHSNPHQKRRQRGLITEGTVADVLGGYLGAKVSSPQQSNNDWKIPGVAGWLTGGGRGLDRRFVPLSECTTDIGAPSFMTDTGPVLSPDLRLDWPDGSTDFIEVKARQYLWRDDERGFLLGVHDHQMQSYRRLVNMGVNLSIIFVAYGLKLLLSAAEMRGEKVNLGNEHVRAWGVWRLGPERIESAELLTNVTPYQTNDQWIALTDDDRIPYEDEIRLINTLSYRAQWGGVDMMEDLQGTHRAGR